MANERLPFGELSHLLPPEVLALGPGKLRPSFDCSRDLAASPWSHGRDRPYIRHVVSPTRTRRDLMREAIRRARNVVEHGMPLAGGGDEDASVEEIDEANRLYLAKARPTASEDTYPLGPLPPQWRDQQPNATLVNSVHKTDCTGSYDAVKEVKHTATRYHNRAMSFLAVQQQLLEFMTPFVVDTSAHHLRIKFRPPERATHRFNPHDTSVQSVGVASDVTGALTANLTVQLIGAALGMPRFTINKSTCHNRVFTVYLPFEINEKIFKEANPHFIENRPQTQCILARPYSDRAPKVHLLVFPSGVIICVGAKQTEEMEFSMAFFLPRLFQARILTPEAAAKRRKKKEADGEKKRRKRAKMDT